MLATGSDRRSKSDGGQGRNPEATVESLIEATIRQLAKVGETGFRLGVVMRETGVPTGSVYHHFGSREGLVAAARMAMYSRSVDEDLAMLDDRLRTPVTHDEFMAAIDSLVDLTNGEDRLPRRMQRAEVVGMAATNAVLADSVGADQRRLVEKMAERLRAAVDCGAIRLEHDVEAVAAMLLVPVNGRTIIELDSRRPPAGEMSEIMKKFVRSVVLRP